MSEASFWRYLVDFLPKEGHYTRIESHDTAPGFPDVHYALNGVTGTIELKDAKKPGAKYPFSGKSGLRPAQIRWMADQIDKAEGLVFLALQCGDRVYLLKADLYYDELHHMTEKDICTVADVLWLKGVTQDKHAVPITRQIEALLTGESVI